MGPLIWHQRTFVPSHTLFLGLGLKEFLQKCITKFIVYIWFATQHPNTNYYLDQIWHETQITIKPLKVLGKKCYMQNAHFLLANPNKIVFHKKINLFFLKYHDSHASNMLFLNHAKILIDNLEWNSISIFLFSTIPIYQPVDIFILKKSMVKSWCTFIEKNYISIFIIKLLMYNQFQYFNLISFIICYRCPKKGHFAKWTLWCKKWATLVCIHPICSSLVIELLPLKVMLFLH